MRLASVRPGDIVRCDVRGLRFLAYVEDCGRRQVAIMPHHPQGISYREVSPRQVVEHWRHRNGKARAA